MSKVCVRCNNEKTDDSFAKNVTKPDGLQNICRSCQHNYMVAWYRTHKTRHQMAVKKRKELIKLRKH
jgi:hypothetical protein